LQHLLGHQMEAKQDRVRQVANIMNDCPYKKVESVATSNKREGVFISVSIDASAPNRRTLIAGGIGIGEVDLEMLRYRVSRSPFQSPSLLLR
jgi:hypothetical protein